MSISCVSSQYVRHEDWGVLSRFWASPYYLGISLLFASDIQTLAFGSSLYSISDKDRLLMFYLPGVPKKTCAVWFNVT
jgi:hypothetical protein